MGLCGTLLTSEKAVAGLQHPPLPSPEGGARWDEHPKKENITMPEYTVPPLPYDYAALEPHIDDQTMHIHHDKHHAAYVNNLNAALKDNPELSAKSVESLISDLNAVPEALRTAVRNNGGGHANHTLFWEIMKPGGMNMPMGALAAAIDATFGDLETLKKQINEAGTKRFGSGWAWLVLDGGKLAVISTANQDSPLMDGKKPLLGVDVWEHAYYLKYQNRRPDYLTAWWNVVNWDEVAARYAAAGGA
jgi:Fe-Mn family superoxide dismutase